MTYLNFLLERAGFKPPGVIGIMIQRDDWANRQLLDEMRDFLARAAPDGDLTDFCYEDPYSSAVMQLFRNGLPAAELWRAFAVFYQRAWFGRTWVLQEFALSTNVKFACGDHQYTWGHIGGLVELLGFPSWARFIANEIQNPIAIGIPRARVQHFNEVGFFVQSPNPMDHLERTLLEMTGSKNWWSVLFFLLFSTMPGGWHASERSKLARVD